MRITIPCPPVQTSLDSGGAEPRLFGVCRVAARPAGGPAMGPGGGDDLASVATPGRQPVWLPQ